MRRPNRVAGRRWTWWVLGVLAVLGRPPNHGLSIQPSARSIHAPPACFFEYAIEEIQGILVLIPCIAARKRRMAQALIRHSDVQLRVIAPVDDGVLLMRDRCLHQPGQPRSSRSSASRAAVNALPRSILKRSALSISSYLSLAVARYESHSASVIAMSACPDWSGAAASTGGAEGRGSPARCTRHPGVEPLRHLATNGTDVQASTPSGSCDACHSLNFRK